MRTRTRNNAAGFKLGAILALSMGIFIAGCGKKEEAADNAKAPAAESKPVDEAASKGVGPIQSVAIGADLDPAMVAKGEKIFSGTCSACHKMDTRYVGPALAGVSKRRTPEWIMNMIMNPAGMTQSDPTAKALLGEYMTQMSVIATEEEARAVLEYFRKHDGI
ncbi:MAG: cytochrome c2 [Fibrobacteres bacterium]|nr:cytochrome c2 [Fibrobacterota bacterium]